MTVMQMAMLTIVGALLALQFQKEKKEYGIYIVIAVSLMVVWGMKEQLTIWKQTMDTVQALLPMRSEFLEILLKMIGITYVAELSSCICKDVGYQTLSNQIEVFTKLTILAYSMPILETLLRTIKELLQ